MSDLSTPSPTQFQAPPGRLRAYWWKVVGEIDHLEVLRALREDGELSGRYLFMVVMAAGIATIGLLLNSPAVIIGAMLISPLMGPIALTGSGIATLSIPRLRAGLTGLAAGAFVALLTAALIVALSPIRENTPELLARTRPNLFDLIVAVLSGLAGGYATVRGKGGAVVGVAIATALMPPLAVVSFGAVSGQWPLAKGAGLLFLTNMVAIALSIALVLTCYGFARRGTRSKLVWQTLLWAVLLAPLAYPLTSSLRSIVDETVFAQQARSQLVRRLGATGRIQTLGVSFPADRQARVDAVALVREPVAGLDRELEEELSRSTDRSVTVTVSQLQVADPAAPMASRSAVANPLSAAPLAAVSEASPSHGFPLELVQQAIDPLRKTAVLVPVADADLPVGMLRRIEADWQARHPGWTIRLQPPLRAMPAISFDFTSAELDDSARRRIADAAWLARAWGVTSLEVVGYASTEGNGTLPLARERARRVADALREAGFAVSSSAIYPAGNQRSLERLHGSSHFRRVDIRPHLG